MDTDALPTDPGTVGPISIRTLLPMACDGIGPSYAAAMLIKGAVTHGFAADLFVARMRMQLPDVTVHTAVPRPLSFLPYRTVGAAASVHLERRYLQTIGDGDVAYLWPSVTLETHHALNRRGIPIVLEGINTRMASAKRILDTAYEAFGAPPAHGITEARIAEEEEKFALSQAIFAPSPPVETALIGSALEHRFIPTSYGVDLKEPVPPRKPETGAPPVFLFCARGVVRKGLHHLLDVWPQIRGARLRLVGDLEPVIVERYRDVLALESVETMGFTRDLDTQFANADVFVLPSLEEGDPLVTYMAARHGLPIIASPSGAGRLGAATGCALIVDPADRDALADALHCLAGSAEARAEWRARGEAAVTDYDWLAVGARRAAALARFMAT